jgi:hypothetical protein
MDSAVERILTRQEEEKEQREKRERALRRRPPPPPPVVKPAVERRMRGFGFAERKQTVEAKPVESFERIRNDIFSSLKRLGNSITNMLALPYLDERQFDTVATRREMEETLRYVDMNMFPKEARMEFDINWRKIADQKMKESLKQYYDWLKDLSNLQRNWVLLQLNILQNMRYIAERRDHLRCNRLIEFSENFARYVEGLDQLSTNVKSIDTSMMEGLKLPSNVLNDYLALHFGMYTMDKILAVWIFIVGRDRYLFQEVRQRDINCSAEDILLILQNLENVAYFLTRLTEKDEKLKSDWEMRLRSVQDLSAQIRDELEKQDEESIDYSFLLK